MFSKKKNSAMFLRYIYITLRILTSKATESMYKELCSDFFLKPKTLINVYNELKVSA